MNYTLITGASSGIGHELAIQFAKNGHHLVLLSRDERRLNQTSDYLENTFKINTLVIPVDLSFAESAEIIFKKVSENDIQVDYLVNNAGFFIRGRFSDTSWENELKLIQLQCLTHTLLTKLFLPGMIKQRKGGIINVCSTGSFVPGPYQAVYSASKSFVLSFSEAISEELSGTGITVTALCPGGTDTEFWRGVSRKETFLFPMMDAAKVAEKGYKAVMKGKRLVIPGLVNRINVCISRFVPRKMMTQLAGKIVKKYW